MFQNMAQKGIGVRTFCYFSIVGAVLLLVPHHNGPAIFSKKYSIKEQLFGEANNEK